MTFDFDVCEIDLDMQMSFLNAAPLPRCSCCWFYRQVFDVAMATLHVLLALVVLDVVMSHGIAN